MTLPLEAVDDVVQYCIRICINYGAQLGASIVLFVVLLLLTKPDKRNSAVFWLNTVALLANIARLVCQIVYFTTPFVKIYPYFTHDYTGVPQSAFANSVLGAVFVFFVVVFMEVSLVLQVQVVCSTFRRLYRRVLLAGSVLMALAPIALRLMLTVISSKHAVTLVPLGRYSNLESTTNIVVTVSICFFCTIFVVKLGFAIKLQKELGVREFGPMKAIFIMGCQTMVVPGLFAFFFFFFFLFLIYIYIYIYVLKKLTDTGIALFSILQYFVHVPELASNVLTLVIIFLPLSSIWAGVSLDNDSHNRSFNNRTSDSHRHLLHLGTSSNSTASRSQNMSSVAGDTSNTTCFAGLRDPEMCKYGIAVEHDISVQSYHKDKPEEV